MEWMDGLNGVDESGMWNGCGCEGAGRQVEGTQSVGGQSRGYSSAIIVKRLSGSGSELVQRVDNAK